jgi:hypothetical protein
VAVPLSGWLVDTFHNWDLVLYMFAVSYVIGAVVWCAWVGGEELQPPDSVTASVTAGVTATVTADVPADANAGASGAADD